MKFETIPYLVQLEKKELEKLCTQVKETVASKADLKGKKAGFGIADLWNARKSMNTAGKRWSSRQLISSRL